MMNVLRLSILALIVSGCCLLAITPVVEGVSIDEFKVLNPCINATSGGAIFTYTLSGAADDHVTLEICNSTGVVDKISDLPGDSGTYTVTWSGTDCFGAPVSDGDYYARLIAFSDDYDLERSFGNFTEPTGVSIDQSNNVYVLDYNSSTVSIFEPDGTPILTWGEAGTGDGQLNHPFGLVVDPSWNVAVADTGNNRVQVFDRWGNLINQWGTYGTGDGQFDMPLGIAFDRSGNSFVVDANNSRIEKFDLNGSYVASWGTNGSEPGQLYHPMFVAVDGAGFVYVVDVGNYRIEKFDGNGNYVAEWGSYGTGDSQFTCPGGISAGKDGNIYVVDVGNHNVQEFDPDGNLISGWSTVDQTQTIPSFPIGVTAGYNETVYVTDYATQCVKKYGKEARGYAFLFADTSVPSTTASLSGTPGKQGWYTTSVVVTLTSTDAEPGFTTEYSLDGVSWSQYMAPLRLYDGAYTLYYRSFDRAGNVEETHSVSFKIDATRPEASATLTGVQGSNGWYTSDVTVSLTSGDAGGSGLNVTQYRIYPDTEWHTYSGPLTVTGEGYNTVYYQAWDCAGNNIFHFASVQIDRIAPAIQANTPADGSVYLLNQNVLAYWLVSDNSSLVAWTNGTTRNNQPIDTASVGTKAYTVQAGDKAGNNASRTALYSVVYNYSGIMSPISPDGTSSFKLGKSVPVQFRLTNAGGNSVKTATASLGLAKVVNGVPGTEIKATSYRSANPDNLFKYDATTDSYVYTLDTAKLSKGTWQLRIRLDDGTTKYATIVLK